MNKQIITGTMLQGSFFSVNKVVAKYLKSNDAALLLSHLIYLQEHHFKGEEFYQQQERLMEECNFSMSVLRKCMNLLSEESIIFIVRKKKPNDATPKNYYSISYTRIAEVMNSFGSQDLEVIKPITSGSQKTVSSDINILSSGYQNLDLRISGSCEQRVYNNKINNSKVNKKEIDNKLNINIRDKLIKDKLYTPGNKIPQSFKGVEEYLEYLYTQNYG